MSQIIPASGFFLGGARSRFIPSGAVAPPDFRTGLVLELLADNYASPVMVDSSGSGNDATFPAVPATKVPGGIGTRAGLDFTGVDSAAVLGTEIFSGAYTVFVVEKSTGDCAILSGTGANQIIRVGEGGVNVMYCNDNITAPISSALSVPRGTFRILAMTVVGGVVSWYENKVAKGTGVQTSQAIHEIGAVLDTVIPYGGNLPLLRVYNAALTGAQLNAVFDFIAFDYGMTT